MGRDRRQGARAARLVRGGRGRRGAGPVSDALPRLGLGRRRAPPRRGVPPVGVRPRLPAGRRAVRDAPGARRAASPSSRSTSRGCGGRPRASRSRCPDDIEAVAGGRDRRPCSAAEGLDGPDGDASIRVTVSRGAWASRGLLPPASVRLAATIVIQAWPVVPPPADHLERGLSLVASAVRRDPANPIVDAQDDVARRLRVRPPRGAPRGRRGRRVPHAERPPVRGDDREHLPRPHGARRRRRAGHARPRLRDPARDHPVVAAPLGRPARACGRSRAGSRPTSWPRRPRRSCRRRSPGVLPVTRFNGHPIGDGVPGPWTLRARAAREAVFGAPEG